MADSRGVSGLGWVALAVVLVGALWLYQREGGKVFDKGHLEPPMPEVEGVAMRLEPGPLSHELLLTHRHKFGPVLSDVQLKAVLYREDGSQEWSSGSGGSGGTMKSRR